MSDFSCPGSVRIKEPVPEFFECPKCASEVEIWTNENTRPCKKCGQMVSREQVPTCVEWCKHAKECVGEEALKRYMDGKSGKEDEKSREEEIKLLKELMEKCQKKRDFNGEKTDNQDR